MRKESNIRTSPDPAMELRPLATHDRKTQRHGGGIINTLQIQTVIIFHSFEFVKIHIFGEIAKKKFKIAKQIGAGMTEWHTAEPAYRQIP